MKISMLAVACALLVGATATAEARGGGHSYSGGSGGHSYSSSSGHSYSTSSDTPRFRTFTCKTDACRTRHPDGTWVHPLTPKKPTP